jgi:GTPase SAR1 family protein
MSQLFFRNADVAFLCFDPKDPPSVTALASWVGRVLKEVPECHLFGVLTKADLYSKDELEPVLEDAKRVLSAAEIGIESFFVTSAVTKSGVEAVFAAAAEISATRVGETQEDPQESSEWSCC